MRQDISRLVSSVALAFQEVHFGTLQNATFDDFVAFAFLQLDLKGAVFVFGYYLEIVQTLGFKIDWQVFAGPNLRIYCFKYNCSNDRVSVQELRK